MKLRDETIGGFAAGVTGTVIGYPLDLVKTRMQTASSTGSQRNNTNMFVVMLGVIRREGFFSIYKGMLPPLVSLSLLNTINFTSYSYFRTYYKSQRGWDARNGLAGATAGPIAASISTIENFIKTQMQLDNVSKKQYRNSIHCASTLWKSNGPRVLYTGLGVNTAREIVFLGTYFYCYEGFREFFLLRQNVSYQIAIPIAGGMAGSLGWLCSFPLDSVRAQVQGQNIINNNATLQQKTKTFAIAQSLWKTKGFRGLFSGVTPSIVRAFLVSGSRFSAYEFAMRLLTGKQYYD
eukprot:CAMPEP_0172433498 /NCGR_PEP_ID=MMETSP1064-20121228/68398_1 /TAXON_ID=202472 /ORGANISM="Aulacoseira subarctica , Strain CCAP 1002/5" /LENGTH=291 /DNA_ID=CAMNT_0013181443 /DNA_START=38 /DNA_END=913 /DNA_ORIENTATION=-